LSTKIKQRSKIFKQYFECVENEAERGEYRKSVLRKKDKNKKRLQTLNV
jgi:hypothetical protein